MKRIHVLDHLAKAEEHVRKGERLVERQRDLIERLAIDGYDLTDATALLQQLEEIQGLHQADCERLRGELATAI